MPKKRAVPVDNAAAESDAEQPAKRVRKTAAADSTKPFPQPVSHPSHLKVPGDVFMLGTGDCGQFGLGEDVTEALRPNPSPLPGKKAIQIAACGMHSIALVEDGSVWTTGVNDEGALGRFTDGQAWEKADVSKQGSAGDQSTWARVSFPSAAGRIVQVSGGDSHSAALDEHGTVFAWGTFRGDSGVFGFAPGTRIALLPTAVVQPTCADEQVVRVVSGTDHILALTNDGSVLSWGSGLVGQLGRVGSRMQHPEETQLTPAAVPFKRTRGVKASSKIVDIAAGPYTCFVCTDDGHVFAWGLNNYGQLGFASKAPAYAPQLVKSLEGKKILEVGPGDHHTLARTQDGQLLSFGRPTYGRLGRKDVDPASDDGCSVPASVDGLEGQHVHHMSAGSAVSSCIAGDNQDAYLWGFGDSSQLGKGDDDSDELVPLKLKETKRFSNRKVLQVEMGGQHVGLLAVIRS
ncbi:hypothetical protein WJX74_002113 [Apatococcus lobatus]|uniref:RCC1-like domain-containing protein n=1 Tax=Apatococcus lobatus TaxID=904363 RepID=A0AAW1QD07_9CHLO